MDATDAPRLGTLRSWKDPWGFIVCPAAFQGDLFAHRQHFVGTVPAGDLTGSSVEFTRALDTKGRAHAANIRLVEAKTGARPGGGAVLAVDRKPLPTWLPAHGPVEKGVGGALGKGATRAVPAVPVGAQIERLAGQRLRGEFRSWKQDWGFIVSPKFAGDIFAHRANLLTEVEPVLGMQVTFTVAVDARGRVTAGEITAARVPEELIGQGVLCGVMRSWRKDWGFIVAPEAFEGDLFCHLQAVQGLDASHAAALESTLPGRSVTFEVARDSRNRLCAANVVAGAGAEGTPSAALWSPPKAQAVSPRPAALILPKMEQPAPGPQKESKATRAPVPLDGVPFDPSEQLVGTLRSWKDPWGFIVCPERFEGDLFAHRQYFSQPVGTEDLVGRQVQFTFATDERGRTHATNVILLNQASPAPQGRLAAARAAQAALRRAADNAPPPGQQETNAGAADNRAEMLQEVLGQTCAGVVRSWRDPWGFIVAPDHFEGDVFVHRESIVGGCGFLTPGAKATFVVDLDDKGRVAASDVQVQSTAADWAGTGTRLQGTLRSWKQDWGFIVSPGSFQGDCFAHMGAFQVPLAAIAPGMAVSFSVEIDQKGRATAGGILPWHLGGHKRIAPAAGLQQPEAKRQRA